MASSFRDTSESGEAYTVASWSAGRRKHDPVVQVPISSLLFSDSPRLAGESIDHVRALAESEASLPPIIVHRSTMQVIDGMHRLRAAVLRGQDEIDVQFFDGDEVAAFVLAVETNITHGLPLSLADRTAAAARIIHSHPRWSDRAIASTVGLAAKTVGAIRRRSTDDGPQLNARVGRDGRVRPLNAAERRKIASELITEKPDAPLREIASAAGISVATAQDVRKRLRRGENPVPQQHHGDQEKNRPEHRKQPGEHDDPTVRRTSADDRNAILQNLTSDPALRFAETGRVLLRLLHALSLDAGDWEQLSDNVPAHCVATVAEAARECGQAWQEFAERMERR